MAITATTTRGATQTPPGIIVVQQSAICKKGTLTMTGAPLEFQTSGSIASAINCQDQGLQLQTMRVEVIIHVVTMEKLMLGAIRAPAGITAARERALAMVPAMTGALLETSGANVAVPYMTKNRCLHNELNVLF